MESSAAQRIAREASDFVSLLLSKNQLYTEKVKNTLDPGLAQHVGLGTLNATRLDGKEPDQDRIFDKLQVANGWRAMDFDKAIGSLKNASTRLQGVVKNEARYWSHLVRVKENNWALCNFNKTTAMGVRFGFIDAASHFRKASLAMLPRSLEDGAPRLQTFDTDMNLRLRVTLEENSKVTGRSRLPLAVLEDAPLEAKILEARNSIFASELWYELNREGRTLLAYEVRENNGTLVCEPPGTKHKISISVEYLDSVRPSEPILPQDEKAEGLLLTLQLLLRYWQRENRTLKLRRKAFHGNPIPAPPQKINMSPPNLPYNLLRPIISTFKYESSVSELLHFFADLISTLRLVGFLDASYVLKTTPRIPTHPPLPSTAAISHFATRFGFLNPQGFRIDLQITPAARIAIRGIERQVPIITTDFMIAPLPPKTSTPNSQKLEFNSNPIASIFPPSFKDKYPTVKEVAYYVGQAAVRMMVLRAEETISSASINLPSPSAGIHGWIKSIGGDSLKDSNSEREVKIEVLRPCQLTRGAAFASLDGSSNKHTELEIDSKFNAAIALTVSFSPDADIKSSKWLWAPDGSQCQRSLSEVIQETLQCTLSGSVKVLE